MRIYSFDTHDLTKKSIKKDAKKLKTAYVKAHKTTDLVQQELRRQDEIAIAY